MKQDKLTEADVGRYIYVYDPSINFFMIGIVSTPHNIMHPREEYYMAGYSHCLQSSNAYLKDDIWCYADNSKERRGWRDVTLEEKHWLDECIIANNFIFQEAAMETYNPICEPQIFN